MFIIFASSRPQVSVDDISIGSHRILLVEPDRSLPFSAAEYLKLRILKRSLALPDVNLIVVNGKHVQTVDVTLAEVCMNRIKNCTFIKLLGTSY